MENKGFQIDANILSRKKKNNNSSNRNNNIKKSKKKNYFISILLIFISIIIGIFFYLEHINNILIKNFSENRIIVCKDRLVSKESGYIFYKNKSAFVNKKDGLFFNIYFCSDFD